MAKSSDHFELRGNKVEWLRRVQCDSGKPVRIVIELYGVEPSEQGVPTLALGLNGQIAMKLEHAKELDNPRKRVPTCSTYTV